MRVLVTGGSGFLGSRLVKKLREVGDEVVVFSEKGETTPGVSFVAGDVRNKGVLEKAFSSVDVVYHLAACLDESRPEMWDINVLGTRNVADLCREHGVKQLIFMSSSGVLGETSKPALELMPYNPQTKYEKSKMEAEKIVKNSGVPYTIIRATIIIGPNMIWASIIEAARRGYPIIGSGKNYLHLVYVNDVVDALIAAKNNIKAANQVFHVAAKDTPTYEEVYRIITQEIGVKPSEKHIPLWLALLASYLHEMSCRLTGRKPKLIRMRSSIRRLVRNRIMSIEKSRNVLGFEPKYSTRRAIKETIKYIQISRLGYSDLDLADIRKSRK